MGLTTIFLKDSSQCKLKDINIGTILESGATVVCKQKILNTDPLYLYKNRIYISGDHRIIENQIILTARESTLSIETSCSPEYLYCITTNTGFINIRGDTFADYSENRNIYLNKTTNDLILNFWNLKKPDATKFSKGLVFLEHGFSSETIFGLQDGTKKCIENIVIGDVLEDNNKVIGFIELDPYYFLFYEFCGVIISSNMKVYDDIYWKNIECVTHAKMTPKPLKVFNIMTVKSLIKCKNNFFLDYHHVNNNEIRSEINKLNNLAFTLSNDNKAIQIKFDRI